MGSLHSGPSFSQLISSLSVIFLPIVRVLLLCNITVANAILINGSYYNINVFCCGQSIL